ncbi:MAG: IS21 family transposase [Olsenella sp.]|jgi:transposase|nr:IS21 family transposase [Olsenella sp.]
MIDVGRTGDMRRRARHGQPVARIARELHVSEPTVRKYRDMEGLSVQPRPKQNPQFPTLEGFRETIDAWPISDTKQWRRQRHTATRVYVRLREEEHHEGSYSTVQRYVRWKRGRMAIERGRRDASGHLPLRWLPGECQVDFGEAGLGVRGVATRGKCLAVTFPHSSVGLTQVFWGEASECVCQGLRNVFESVGGAPVRAVFDDAAEVGRRFGAEIRVSKMFELFASHCGLDHSFANPRSGNEKGNCENMVGAHRRALFVPVPSLHDVVKFNERLLKDSLDLSGKRHYRLGAPQLEPSEGDREALLPLPAAPFSRVRREARARRANKQGEVVLGGMHRYNVGPAMAGREVTVGLGAFGVAFVDAMTGEALAAYEREWGPVPTSSADPTPQLKLLCMRPGGWRDSVVRDSLPGEPVAFLDAEDAAGLSADLGTLRDAAERSGFRAAAEGMARPLSATGSPGAANVGLPAAAAASGDEAIVCDRPVDPSVYDEARRVLGGGGHDVA